MAEVEHTTPGLPTTTLTNEAFGPGEHYVHKHYALFKNII